MPGPDEKITAIILTLNEEPNLRGAIESCSFADEILVVDSFSTDQTVEVAKSFPEVRVVQHEYTTSAAQRNWGVGHASHNWIFYLDADERAPPELAREMRDALRGGTQYSAFRMKRQNYFMGQKIRFVWRGDTVTRLFRKDRCRYNEERLSPKVELLVSGPAQRLKGKLIHDTYNAKGLDGYLKKIDRYTTTSALDRLRRGRTGGAYYIAVKPLLVFLKHYLLLGGIFDGRTGFVISRIASWQIFLRGVKMERMKKGEKFEHARKL